MDKIMAVIKDRDGRLGIDTVNAAELCYHK